MVRIGKITDVKESDRTARAVFEDTGLVSGWLKVLASPPKVEVKTADGHTHDTEVKPWMPEVNDIVLVVYRDGFNEDGFVVGRCS